jgi:hypothetical protein
MLYLRNSSRSTAAFIGLSALLLLSLASAQLASQAPTRILGTLTQLNGNALSVKSDAGVEQNFTVTDATIYKRIAPGQKDLSTADSITLADIAKGDRVLVNFDTATPPNAIRIIAIKAQDLAAKQQKDNEDWQKNGVNGLVKSADPSSGVIQITSGIGAAAKTITIHTSASTVLKRYAATNVTYANATAAPFASIHAGDQLRARGTKNSDGTDLVATEVVSGTFLNLSGKLDSIDTAASTISLKDLATKKMVTVHITNDAQMRQLPDQMAQMLGARLKAGAASTSTSATPASSSAPRQSGAGNWSGGNGGNGPGGTAARDPQQMLSRAPQIHFADLKKGDVVMMVATDNGTQLTAISLLSGVEPLLEAPAASKDLLSNWSVGGGGEGAAAGAQ